MSSAPLVARIEAAIGGPAFDQVALEATADVVGNDRGVWIRHAAAAGATMLLAPFMTAATLAMYAREYAPINPYIPHSLRLPAGTVIRTSTVIPVREHQRSEYFSWADREMGTYELALFVSRSDDCPLIVSFGRSRAKGDFTQVQEARMQAFAPHLRRAYFLHTRIGRPTATFASLLAHAADSGACFALSRQGTLIDSSAVGDLELQDGSAVSLVNGHIRFRAPAAQRSFSLALRKRAQSTAFRFSPDATDGTALLVDVSTLSVPPASRPAHWLLFVPAGSGSKQRVRLESFCLEHGLTGLETEVLRLLAKGQDTGEIATQLGHSPETTRSVLKSLFRKTGTHRQTQLVLRALAQRDPMQ